MIAADLRSAPADEQPVTPPAIWNGMGAGISGIAAWIGCLIIAPISTCIATGSLFGGLVLIRYFTLRRAARHGG